MLLALWHILAVVYWPYLRYVFVHKYFVYREGRKLALGRPRLLAHDRSKFSAAELGPYAWYFNGGTVTFDRQRAFDVAWLHHQHANPHHYQHWILRNDDGIEIALPMPDVLRREMLADWRAAGLALGKPDTPGWYRRNAAAIKLHVETREWVERQLFDGQTMAEHDAYAAARAAWRQPVGRR